MYRINALLKLQRQLFHTRDLALLWGIDDDNILYTQISRYVKKGILIPIHKGFYSVVSISQLDPILLGIGYLHRYAYLSGEYVLALSGVIFQNSSVITLVSSVSRTFGVAGFEYRARKLHDRFLFNGIGITQIKGYSQADVERAAADLLYFNPRVSFDNPKALDWQIVSKIQKEVGYL